MNWRKVALCVAAMFLFAVPSWAGSFGVYGSYWDSNDASSSWGGGVRVGFDFFKWMELEFHGTYFPDFGEDILGATVDITAIVQRVDVNQIVQQVDVDAVMQKVDLDAVLGRLDMNAIAQRIDIDAMVQQTDLGVVRSQTVGLDEFIARWVARLRRRTYTGPHGPAGPAGPAGRAGPADDQQVLEGV